MYPSSVAIALDSPSNEPAAPSLPPQTASRDRAARLAARQVGGLAFFLYLGSPQSREGDERKEAKLDAILRQLGPEGVRTIAELDQKYPRR
jgi:hypothetical protein